MKKIFTLLFCGFLLFCSCQKTDFQEDSGWNALAFTESKSSNYSDYMNEPHINISFPSNTDSKSIVYEKGIWKENSKTYVLTAHNWTDKEIIMHIYKDNILFNEFALKPESATGKDFQVSIKDFSLNFTPSPGKYSFKVSVKDQRGVTLLNDYPLHGSSNKMTVN